jgi:hypothetical protein
LEITYEIRITITADNNFTDNSGAGTHGSIKVDSGNETAPFPFVKVVGESATLEAVSPQTDNEVYQRIWHTGEIEKSEWQRNGQFAWYDQAHTFTVSEEDYAAHYQAQLRQIRVTTSGALSQNENWFTDVVLLDNVTVPSGVTLTITEDAVVNLNGHNLLLSGGNIIIESGANVNYLAKLKNSSNSLLGYYPNIQSAINDAGYVQTVELLDQTYNESFSVVSKYRRYLVGASSGNTVINGNITITNSSYSSVSNLRMGNGKTITVNGGYRSKISSVSATSGSGLLNAYV